VMRVARDATIARDEAENEHLMESRCNNRWIDDSFL